MRAKGPAVERTMRACSTTRSTSLCVAAEATRISGAQLSHSGARDAESWLSLAASRPTSAQRKPGTRKRKTSAKYRATSWPVKPVLPHRMMSYARCMGFIDPSCDPSLRPEPARSLVRVVLAAYLWF